MVNSSHKSEATCIPEIFLLSMDILKLALHRYVVTETIVAILKVFSDSSLVSIGCNWQVLKFLATYVRGTEND